MFNSYKLEAVNNKVIVRPIKKEKTTTGGIILPEIVEENSPQTFAEVISVGDEVKGIEIGDYILCHKSGGQDMMLEKVVFKVLIDQEIYCVVKETKKS